jgi:hypothetical protein
MRWKAGRRSSVAEAPGSMNSAVTNQALGLAKAPGQVPLGGNRHVAGRLPAGAYPQVERGSSRRERITLRRGAECHGRISTGLKRASAGGPDAALTASRDAGRRLFTSSAGKNVIKGAAEQTADGIELLILDCHVAGKIAFDEQRRLIIMLARPGGEGNVSANRRRRRRLHSTLLHRPAARTLWVWT